MTTNNKAMKILNLFNFRICYSFSFYHVQKVTVPIPDKADDTHYDYDSKQIIYWRGSKKHIIALPPHKTGKELSLTPMYNSSRTDYNTDRVIEVELLK